jgi:hypothetical protein
VRTMAIASHGTMVSKTQDQFRVEKVVEWYEWASRSETAAMKTLRLV